MKKLLVTLLALTLVACQPKVVYVVVTATPGPADMTPIIIPTDTPQAAAESATSASTESPTDTPASAAGDSSLTGDAVFTNIAVSGKQLYLQCPPAEVTFGVTIADSNISDVDLWYRMVDKKSGTHSSWMLGKKMITTDNSNFTLLFSARDINKNFLYKEAWLEFQFIGMNKYGNVLARSDRFTEQITFNLDCP